MPLLREALNEERSASAAGLDRMLVHARERTLAFAHDLSGERLLGPKLAIVNPPLWEIGHAGWFQERWCLRTRADGTIGESILPGADALYDSSAVAHDTRWDLPLPNLEATLRYLDAVLQRVRERLAKNGTDAALLYFVELTALHEEMHAEAFTYTRQTHGYAAPRDSGAAPAPDGESAEGDVEVSGGEFMLGATPSDGFVFDNEKWAHAVCVQPFAIARCAVSNDEFAAFVDDSGYARRELWSDRGWQWRTAAGADHPLYWKRSDGEWHERIYDAVLPLAPRLPVLHVSWYEADAYCRWAGRRLPTEAEWECAAASAPGGARKTRYPWGDAPPDSSRANLYGSAGGRATRASVAAYPHGDSEWGCRQMIGNAWEWTSSAFGPYPGFTPDPYKEYSQPWFGDHRVLRGGSFATRAHLIRNTWRNFYTPDRRDVFAGFRTCAHTAA